MAFSPSATELSGEDFVVVEERELHGYNADGILPPTPEDFAHIREWLDPTNYNSPGGELSKNQNYYTHTLGNGSERRGSISSFSRPPTSVFCGFKEFQGAENV